MEVKELMAEPKGHDRGKCPFCPMQELKEYLTYAGDDDDKTALRDIMVDPTQLVSRQSKARPKDGKDNNQMASTPQPLPPQTKEADLWIDKDSPDKFDTFSFQAHHLISKGVLRDSSFKCWIVKGRNIRGNTGYSVNNADNGIFAPSIPDKFKGKWTKEKKQRAAAFFIMGTTKIQFHNGPHNITDKENDPDGKFHKKYNIYVQTKLEDMNNLMALWRKACPECEPPSDDEDWRPQPSAQLNQYLDNLSRHLKRKISGSAVTWDIFLSAFALEYHMQEGCTHEDHCDLK
jgi:hypothetical protein